MSLLCVSLASYAVGILSDNLHGGIFQYSLLPVVVDFSTEENQIGRHPSRIREPCLTRRRRQGWHDRGYSGAYTLFQLLNLRSVATVLRKREHVTLVLDTGDGVEVAVLRRKYLVFHMVGATSLLRVFGSEESTRHQLATPQPKLKER